MPTTKYDIEKFNTRNDFGLCKMKMKATLIQQDVEKALLPNKDLPKNVTKKERQEFQREAYNSII